MPTPLWKAVPVDPHADIVTPVVRALMGRIVAQAPGTGVRLGHVYDTRDDDVSPDVVTRLQNGPPDVLCWLTQYFYDVKPPEWGGGINLHWDDALLQVMFILMPTDGGGGGTRSQAIARIWPPLLKELIDAENTLDDTCWQAWAAGNATVGPWADLDQKSYHVVQIPVRARWQLARTNG